MDLWDRAKDILVLALERAPEERDDFVRRACGENDELREEVESLLFYHDQADTLLETPAALHVLEQSPGAVPGRLVGAFRIVREIGHGGMAVVYLGERDDGQFRMRAAIKMLKPGVYSREILQRFANERQTLAALDHPNIVKLLDGGSTEDGLPYLVMEYVEGVSMVEYCDAHLLSVNQRLGLFLKVCAAVEYAHRSQVIHRDLKPGNILITQDGVPRLLDFGIAKLLNPALQQVPLATSTGWRPMTVEYASPEQVRGDLVTCASDIYSLGVLLYELLAGRRPFEAEHRSRQELEEVICVQEPEPPSSVRRAAGGNLRLNRDLDTIVLKALSKRPEERFLTVADFAADLERHLSGQPIQARKPGLLYRGTRFARRHRESLTTALAVLLVAAAGGAWWVHSLTKRNASIPRAAASVHTRRSIAVWGLENLSGRPDAAWLSTALSETLAAHLAAGEELRVAPAETVARAKADFELGNREVIPRSALSRLRKNLGSDWIVLGSYRDEGPEHGGETRVDVHIENMITGETTAAVSETGSDREVLDLALRAGTRLRERFGISGLSTVEEQQIRAAFPSRPQAMRLYSRAVARLNALDALGARGLLVRAAALDTSAPLTHSALANAWRTLGYGQKAAEEAKLALDHAGGLSRENHLLVEAGFDEATSNWPQAIAAYQVLASLFPDSLDYALDLASAQSVGGHGKDALDTLAHLTHTSPTAADDPRVDLAVAAAAASLGDSKLRRDAADRAAVKADRQGALRLAATARATECRALANLGDNQRSGDVCQAAYRSFSEAGDREGMARTLHAMAEVPLNQGDYARSAELDQQALAILREIGDHQAMGATLVNIGLVRVKQGDFTAAHKRYAESLENYKLAGDKGGIAIVTGNSGNLYRAEGKLPEALANYERVLALSNEMGDRRSSALALAAIGDVRMDEGDLKGAETMYRQSLAVEQEIGEKSYAAERKASIGELLLVEGQTDRAIQTLQEALQDQEQLGKHGSVAETRLVLSEAACDLGRAQEAEQLARSALAEFQRQGERDKEISALATLSQVLLREGKADDAARVLEPARDPAAHSFNLSTKRSLDLAYARVLAATGHAARAEQTARKVLAQAGTSMVWLKLEAGLTLGEVELKRHAAAGRKQLADVAKAAHAKGFEQIARRASAPI
ncbi:MAG TPA: protein kinase [Bryobacteraceae bacterium]|nr:protein kinase [Bryobacteraceae bacterium]